MAKAQMTDPLKLPGATTTHRTWFKMEKAKNETSLRVELLTLDNRLTLRFLYRRIRALTAHGTYYGKLAYSYNYTVEGL